MKSHIQLKVEDIIIVTYGVRHTKLTQIDLLPPHHESIIKFMPPFLLVLRHYFFYLDCSVNFNLLKKHNP